MSARANEIADGPSAVPSVQTLVSAMLRWLPRAVRELQTGTPITLSVGAVAALALTTLAHAQTTQVYADVRLAQRTYGCGGMSLPPDTITKWVTTPRLWGRQGSWPIAQDGLWTCGQVGISRALLAQVQYITLLRSDGSKIILCGAGPCP